MPQARSSGVLRWPNAIAGFLGVITKRLANYALIGSIPVGSTIISGAYTPLRSNIVEQNRTQFRLGWTRGSDWSRFVRTLARPPESSPPALSTTALRTTSGHRRCSRAKPPPLALPTTVRWHHLPPAATITVARNLNSLCRHTRFTSNSSAPAASHRESSKITHDVPGIITSYKTDQCCS